MTEPEPEYDDDQEDNDTVRALYTPIAREGEPIYASIIRNRSGMDAGHIDYGCRMDAIADLCDAEKQDIVDIAYALYENICRACGDRLSTRDATIARLREACKLVLRRGDSVQRSDQYMTEVLLSCERTLAEAKP